MNTTDSALLERWIYKRDPEAMALIVARYSGMVYATCNRVTRNAADAEDIAQECFLKLSSVQRAGTSLAGLLHTMATRLSLNKARGDARRRAREVEYTAMHAGATEATWDDIQPLIDEAIAALPEGQSTVLIRHFLRGETHGQIADDLGLTRAAVSKRVTKGVEEVREALRRRGVIASVASLGAMLAAARAEAAPIALTESLGRLAVSGAGRAGTHWAAAGSMAWGKVAALIVLTAAGIGAVAWRAPKEERPPAATLAHAADSPEPIESVATQLANTIQVTPANMPAVSQAEEDDVVTGVVRSALGTPQPKANLVKTRIGVKSVRVTSNEAGLFEIPRNEAAGTWVSMGNSLEESAIITIPPTPEPESLDVVLDGGVVEVFGRVTGPDGDGIVNAEIEFEFFNGGAAVHLLSGWTQTDTHGYYAAYLPSADRSTLRVRVAAQQDEASGAWSAPITLSNDLYYAEVPDISITGQAAIRLASLGKPGRQAEDPYHAFGGSIVDTEGNPIAGARLYLTDLSDSGASCRAKTDAQGRWQRLFPASTDRLSVDVRHPDFVPSRLSQEHSSPPSQDRMRDGSSIFVIERGTAVEGVVRDSEGRPAVDVLVKLLPEGNLRTDTDGRFTTPSLPAGQWPITLVHPQYATTAAVIEVPSDKPMITLQIDDGGTIAGRVVNPDGEAISGVRVRANELFQDSPIPTNLRIEATTGESGEFRLDRIPRAGQVRITVEAEKDANGTMPLLPISTFALSPRQEPYEITLYPPPQVHGIVLDEKTGEAITAFTVENRSESSTPVGGARYMTRFPKNSASIADEEGRFTRVIADGYVELIPNDELFVDIVAPGYIPASSPAIHVGDSLEPLVIRLQRAELVRGTILGLSGAPKSGVQVAWANSEHRIAIQQGKLRAFREEREFSTTDDAGHFAFELGGRGGELVAVCDEGYVMTSVETFTSGASLKLLPWSQIRGVYTRGGFPRPEALIDFRDVATGVSESRSALLWQARDTTHTDGSFSFDFVPSLPLELGESIIVQGRQNLWPGTVLEPEPGESVAVELGGEAGSIVGNIVLPEGVEWVLANVRIVVSPTSHDSEVASLPEIVATVEQDGSFRIENLAAGSYRLSASLHDTGPDPFSTDLGGILAQGAAEFTIGTEESNAVTLPDVLMSEIPGMDGEPK